MEFIINNIDVSDQVQKLFLEQTKVTQMTIILHDLNDSDF